MFPNDLLVVYLLLFVIISCPYVNSMTREQMKNSSKLLKKTCMGKNDVTEDQVGELDKGKFLEEKNVMCYIACVYNLSGMVKNNKLTIDALAKQVDMVFPTEMREPVKATIEKCKGVEGDVKSLKNRRACMRRAMCVKEASELSKKYKDICEASYWTAKCMYEEDPANFVFA